MLFLIILNWLENKNLWYGGFGDWKATFAVNILEGILLANGSNAML
jgi:hypothetical protein